MLFFVPCYVPWGPGSLASLGEEDFPEVYGIDIHTKVGVTAEDEILLEEFTWSM